MIRLGKHHAGHPGIVVDEHFLQTEEVPRGFGWVGRFHAAGRLFQRSLQRQSPDQQQGRDGHHADQFGIDQVGPDQHFFVVQLFARLEPLGDAIVVFDRLGRGQPGEEPQQIDQADDRHVVGLGDDGGEVGIGHRQAHDDQHHVQQCPGDHRLDDLPAQDEQHGQNCRRANAVDDRPGGRVDGILDGDRDARRAAADGQRAEDDHHPGKGGPDQGVEIAVLEVPEVIGGDAIDERQRQIVSAQEAGYLLQEFSGTVHRILTLPGGGSQGRARDHRVDGRSCLLIASLVC